MSLWTIKDGSDGAFLKKRSSEDRRLCLYGRWGWGSRKQLSLVEESVAGTGEGTGTEQRLAPRSCLSQEDPLGMQCL